MEGKKLAESAGKGEKRKNTHQPSIKSLFAAAAAVPADEQGPPKRARLIDESKRVDLTHNVSKLENVCSDVRLSPRKWMPLVIRPRTVLRLPLPLLLPSRSQQHHLHLGTLLQLP